MHDYVPIYVAHYWICMRCKQTCVLYVILKCILLNLVPLFASLSLNSAKYCVWRFIHLSLNLLCEMYVLIDTQLSIATSCWWSWLVHTIVRSQRSIVFERPIKFNHIKFCALAIHPVWLPTRLPAVLAPKGTHMYCVL